MERIKKTVITGQVESMVFESYKTTTTKKAQRKDESKETTLQHAASFSFMNEWYN